MNNQESFQTPLFNREKLINEYRHLRHARKESREMPPGQQTRLLQRLAELQTAIGKDTIKIDAEFKNAKKEI